MNDEEMIDILKKFIDWNIFNGAPGNGQALYNDGGNPWLHSRIPWFLEEYALWMEWEKDR